MRAGTARRLCVAAAGVLAISVLGACSRKEEEPDPCSYGSGTVHVLRSSPSRVGEKVVGTKANPATLHIFPNAPQEGDMIACGEGATLLMLSPVKGKVLVSGNGARLVREESIPEPADLTFRGNNTSQVVCTKDGVTKEGLPTCRSFIKDTRGLKW